MTRLFVLLTLSLAASGVLASELNQTSSDSLVDVFPLAVGNQWTYGYDYTFGDVGVIYDFRDTGFVNIRIVGATSTADSNRWLVQEVGTHWTTTNGMPWQGPTVKTDTLELVELTSAKHRLYISKGSYSVRSGVWPFLENLVDTAQVTRYAPVDTAGNATIRTYAYPNRTPIFIFVFKRGIGPSTVAESDGRTGFPWYGTHHTLRDATVTGTRHDERGQAPKAYSLYQNYPNPFNPVTSVSFDVQSRSYVTVEIFDTMGRRLSTIVSETLEPGRHVRQWNALGFSSGTYFCRMKVGGVVQTRSLLLVK